VKKEFNCPCENCRKATVRGIKSMREEGSPEFCIYDYIQEMETGLWIECENCPDNKWENK